MQAPAQRQQLAQQVRGDAVGDQGGEAGLQVGQLRVVRSGSSPASGWKVRAGWLRQSQCNQRGLASCSAPNKLRTTIVRVSLCRRARPQSGQATCLVTAVLTCCSTTVSCTAASRSFASASCKPRVSGARSSRSKVNTSRTMGEASVSSSGCTITCTLNFIPGSPQRRSARPRPGRGELDCRTGGRNAPGPAAASGRPAPRGLRRRRPSRDVRRHRAAGR